MKVTAAPLSTTRAPDTSPTAHSRTGFAAATFAAVADKTGYPADMLGMEMHLEADLGIDSIKRVEILSTAGNLTRLQSVASEPARPVGCQRAVCRTGHWVFIDTCSGCKKPADEIDITSGRGRNDAAPVKSAKS